MRNTILSSKHLVLVILLSCVLSGCPSKQFTITSEPSNATVYVNGVKTGITSLTTSLDFYKVSDPSLVVLKLENYKTESRELGSEDAELQHFDLKAIETIEVELVTYEPIQAGGVLQIGLVRRKTLAYLETIERSPNAKSVTRVTKNDDVTLKIGAPVLSPSEDEIVYDALVEEDSGGRYSNIWKQKVGSTARTRVTFGKASDLRPCYSSDGKHIYFSSNRAGGTFKIWRVLAAGSGGITRISSNRGHDLNPSIGTASGVLAFGSLPLRGQPEIWTSKFDGTLPTQLRVGTDPQVSPDGTRILFLRPVPGSVNITERGKPNYQIWIMNTDGSGETQLTQNKELTAKDPRWSPDGKWIVYVSNEGLDSEKRNNYDIWIMAADGGGRTQLTTNGSEDDHPCWDREGKSIYFRSNRGGSWDIWRFTPILPE